LDALAAEALPAEARDGAPRVLIIDDSRPDHALLHLRLAGENYRLEHAVTVNEGMAAALAHPPDLILLDLNIGDQSGFVVCAKLKAHATTRDVPIIFLSATTDVRAKVRCFDLGAVDYVVKPFEPSELRARMRAALRIKRSFEQLVKNAQVDGLTGVWNRRFFDEELARMHAASLRLKRPFAVVLADLDHFKRINDVHGHPVGDSVLQAAAAGFLGALRATDRLCRYGGEEFAAIIADADSHSAEVVGERMRRAVERSTTGANQQPLVVTASLGTASSDRFTSSFKPEDLVAASDVALYQAKRDGRNRVVGAPVLADLRRLLAVGG
jgi:diguanylate cyclase (GGDEF)-like protein